MSSFFGDSGITVELVSCLTGLASLLISFLGFRFQLEDRRKAQPPRSFRLGPFMFLILAFVFLGVAAAAWSFSGSATTKEQLGDIPTPRKVEGISLPARARLELLGVELSPPARNASVRIKAFIGDDTFMFPSEETRTGLPASMKWNGQSAVFSTGPRSTIQFELEFEDRQSGYQTTLLSTERISYKAGEVNALYTVTGPDATAPNVTNTRKASITYRLQPAP